MHLFTLWPFNPKQHFFLDIQDHSMYQVWTVWHHSFPSYAVDKQTDGRTDMLPTWPIDRLSLHQEVETDMNLSVCTVQGSRDPGRPGAWFSALHNQGVHASDRLVWLWDGPTYTHAGTGFLSVRLPPLAGMVTDWLLFNISIRICLKPGFHYPSWRNSGHQLD